MTLETFLLTTFFLLAFIVFFLVREYFHYKQIMKLQKQMFKNPDFIEMEAQANTISLQENEIMYDDPDFDFTKANKIIVDGQNRPLDIL